ncbi:hypothetical protein AB0B45_30510 [Nonomuraea sp. NPDC049152]|uniref:hypothetical protein n=1 Tax=Nonomuraea sp. NPDC049152 TaxID=3154350 RepID=UPI0033F946D8
MIKKLAFSGAVLAAFGGLAIAGPALADTYPQPGAAKQNVSAQNGNTAVCGNSGIGDITVALVPLNPIVFNEDKSVNCSVQVDQD